jgi:hypothetical protein
MIEGVDGLPCISFWAITCWFIYSVDIMSETPTAMSDTATYPRLNLSSKAAFQ